MPHFDPFYAAKLLGGKSAGDAQSVLDLRGCDAEAARMALASLLADGRQGPRRSVAVLLDPPPPGGGETLFVPVGRQLLAARKAGDLVAMSTLPAQDGLGYFVTLAGDGTSAGA